MAKKNSNADSTGIDSNITDMNQQLSALLNDESTALFGADLQRSNSIIGLHNRYNSVIQKDYQNVTSNKRNNDSTFEYITNSILNKPHDYSKDQKTINRPGATTGNKEIDKLLKNKQLEDLFTMGDSQIATHFLSTSSDIMHIYDEIDSVCAYFWQLDEAACKIRDDVLRADRVNEDISMDIRFPGITQDVSSYITTVKKALDYQNLGIKIRDHVSLKAIKYGKYFIMLTPYNEIGQRLLSLNSGYGYGRYAYYESTDTRALLQDNGVTACMENVTAIFESFSDNLEETDSGKPKLTKAVQEKLELIKENIKNIYVCEDTSVPDVEGFGKLKNVNEVIKQSSLDALTAASKEIEKLDSPTYKPKLKTSIHIIEEDGTSLGKPVSREKYEYKEELIKAGADQTIDSIKIKQAVSKLEKNNQKTTTTSKKDTIHATTNQYGITPDDLTKSEQMAGCHIKLVDPRQMFEIKIFDYVIGYYYFENYDFARMGTSITDIMSNQMNFDQRSLVIDNLVDSILKNLKYGDVLKGDDKLKNMILNCVLYAERRDNPIRIKFVKADLVIPWQTNLDEHDNGQPVLLRSLMFARLYTSLMLFYATAIVTKSTDSEFYYLKESALDGQINNQISDMMDQLEDSNIDPVQIANGNILHGNKAINKRYFLNMGTDEIKPFEMDVVSGQQLDIHTDFLNDLKKMALGATSVPAVAIDALDELEFATTYGMLNINHLTRCNNVKKDFNVPLTETVKRVIRYCFPNSIPDNILDKLELELRQSRVIEDNITNEQLNNNIGLAEGMLSVFLGGDNTTPPEFMNFVTEYMKKKLVMYLTPSGAWDQLPDMYKEAILQARANQLRNKVLTNKESDTSEEE